MYPKSKQKEDPEIADLNAEIYDLNCRISMLERTVRDWEAKWRGRETFIADNERLDAENKLLKSKLNYHTK